eukprot:gene16969-23241_t
MPGISITDAPWLAEHQNRLLHHKTSACSPWKQNAAHESVSELANATCWLTNNADAAFAAEAA